MDYTQYTFHKCKPFENFRDRPPANFPTPNAHSHPFTRRCHTSKQEHKV
jgi:hypothetical protein